MEQKQKGRRVWLTSDFTGKKKNNEESKRLWRFVFCIWWSTFRSTRIMKATFYCPPLCGLWLYECRACLQLEWRLHTTAIPYALVSCLSSSDGLGFVGQSLFISQHLALAWNKARNPINASWDCYPSQVIHEISSLLRIWSIKLT